MPGVVLVGLQWGDEGKGKLVDYLAPRFDAVVRFQGGANAGHTVMVGGERRVFHLVPSGALRGVPCYIGSGVVVDTSVLTQEISFLRQRVQRLKLMVSGRAHVTTPIHKLQDGLEEGRRGEKAVGTTRRGIGPSYSDKALRIGIRVSDLVDPDALRERLRLFYEAKKSLFKSFYGYSELPEFDELYNLLKQHGEVIKPFVGRVENELINLLKRGARVLFEGAQGTLLDIDHGTYPYVTSSNTVAASASTGSGVPMKFIRVVLGVAKAYMTRVGGGPFPTEEKGEVGEAMRRLGGEYGATTGRPRRCGWLDSVATRFSVRINGADQTVLTKLDVLSSFNKVKICVAYRINGSIVDEMPDTIDELEAAVPVYETLEGWRVYGSSFWRDAKKRGYGALPPELKMFIKRVEELLETKVTAISYGPSRDELIDLGLELA